MTSETLLASARDGYLSVGRGVVMTTDDREEDWYATMEDLRVALFAAPELEGPVRDAEEAGAGYDPETEAVVVDSRYEGVSLYLVRARRRRHARERGLRASEVIPYGTGSGAGLKRPCLVAPLPLF